MNYDEMTDFEINKAVAKKWLPCDYKFNDKSKTVDLVGYVTYLGPHGMPDERLEKYGEFDPCNNWSDIGHIIEEYDIAIIPTGQFDVWCAIHKPDIDSDNKIHANILEYNENPKRTAAICFLEMMEAKCE